METCGILLAIPFGFVASFAYSYYLQHIFPSESTSQKYLLRLSWGLLVAFAVELGCVVAFGILRSSQVVGRAFIVVHNIAFLFSTPAFANILLLPAKYRFKPPWQLVAIACFCIAMFDLFYNIKVHETLYGVD